MDVKKLFDKHEDEFHEFEVIVNPLHPRRDLCAMLYLDKKFPGKKDAIGGAEHHQIWFGWDMEEIELTEDDVIYLARCGVFYDIDADSLSMFV